MDKIQSTHKGLLSCKSISKEKSELFNITHY